MLKPLLDKLNNMRVILATSSSQRRLNLESTQLKFEACASNFEENLRQEDFTFSEFVQETARGKVEDVYEQLKNDKVKPDIIIGFDTVVTHDGKMFAKPKTKEQGIEMITQSAKTGIPNVVYTGVVIKYKEQIFTEVTAVYLGNMGKLTEEEIVAYVETGESMGNSGGEIQGIAGSFRERIEGDFNNILHLPLYKLTQKLKKLLLC